MVGSEFGGCDRSITAVHSSQKPLTCLACLCYPGTRIALRMQELHNTERTMTLGLCLTIYVTTL